MRNATSGVSPVENSSLYGELSERSLAKLSSTKISDQQFMTAMVVIARSVGLVLALLTILYVSLEHLVRRYL